MIKLNIYLLLNILLLTLSRVRADLPGTWELLVPDAGIASMHTAVTHYGMVVLLDQKNSLSRLLLPKRDCSNDENDGVLKHNCYANSAVFDPTTNTLRPLTIQTDTMCSSGQFLPDGTLLQTGGDTDGWRKIRKFVPCETSEACDWEELNDVELAKGRWYATNQILPDGSVIIIGGRFANSLEFYPPRKQGEVNFPFLAHVHDIQDDNLYPYVHLLPNGKLFIFANNKAVLYDYEVNVVVKNYPTLEGGPRNYPSAGSSVMLPLEGDFSTAVIVICGGAQFGAFLRLGSNVPAQGSCGRIIATSDDPVWEMEDMPFARIMGDMVMLPTGDVLIINGAKSGSQGVEFGSNPCLHPVLYRPDESLGSRFMVLNPGTVPRMYHSTANLLPDGRVLLAGSNPHYFYTFKSEYPTEFRLEAFSPEYLSPDRANLRPVIVTSPQKVKYREAFEVEIVVTLPIEGPNEVNLGNAPFATHSFSQGQRLVKLNTRPAVPSGVGSYKVSCVAPPNSMVAPPGYYMMFVVNQGVPSEAKWVQLVV
ncbi:aldehyde oxidase GLOX-like [Silene latifolia]|uniref:aldehyde oxidase GLOX-like n=1 Tax=Silene latifolia TaxID=37657 RepID=UPI003D76DC58